MSRNSNLTAAKKAKNDEFYTRITDIEKELVHYKDQLRGKTVFCNCDDPEWSDFWRYFDLNFDFLGIEALIATHYDPEEPTYKLEIRRDPVTGAKLPPVRTDLKQNGDFRSPECVELLKSCDVVVTNPPFSCYSDDTEVKTDHGWKLFKDVSDDDLTLSVDLKTNRIEYARIRERLCRPVHGDLLHFRNRRMDLLVTDNHRMVYRYRNCRGEVVQPVDSTGDPVLLRADAIRKAHFLPTRGFSWEGSRAPENFVLPAVTQMEQYSRREIEVPEKGIPMKDWLEFFGFFLADGCWRDHINTCGKRDYTISLKQADANAEYVLNLVSRIGFTCRQHTDGDTGKSNFDIYSKQLWEYLSQFGRSATKFIPAEYLSYDKETLTYLWKGYLAGDSYVSGGMLHVGTVSKRLAEDLQELYLKVSGSVLQIRRHNAVYRGEPYEYYEGRIVESDRPMNTKYGVPERVPYDGNVYCLTLEKNGTMLVRRNGIVSWSGNCFREYVAQLMQYRKKFIIIGNMNAITYKEFSR